MKRKFWINAHLYVAAFFAPALIIIATSGGLYLLGFKGVTQATPVELTSELNLDVKAKTLEADIRSVLAGVDPNFNFEYLKISGKHVMTRPTSKRYFDFHITPARIVVTEHQPSLVKRLVELHKGHGPLWFKDFQKAMAVGLLFVILTGVWLGLSAAGLRTNTAVTMGAGLLVFVSLAFVL